MAEHIYEAGAQRTSGAVAGALASVVPGTLAAGIRMPEIREIGIFNVSGVAAEIGLGYPAALGTGGVATSAVVQGSPVDACGHTVLALTYTTLQPTAPAAYMRRAELQGAVGADDPGGNPGEFIRWSGAAINAPVIYQISALAVTYDIYCKVAE